MFLELNNSRNSIISLFKKRVCFSLMKKAPSRCHKHPSIDALVRCPECKMCYCADCENEFHKVFFPGHHSQPLSQQRSHVPPSSAPPPPPPPRSSALVPNADPCPVHKGYPLDLFCMEDNSFLCSKCVHEKKVDKSKIMKIGEALCAKRKDLEACRVWATEEHAKLTALHKYLDEKSSGIDTQKEEVLSLVRASFDRIRRAVDEREESLLCDVEKRFREVDPTTELADALVTLEDDVCDTEANIAKLIDECDKCSRNSTELISAAISAETECKKLMTNEKSVVESIEGNGRNNISGGGEVTVSVECSGEHLDKLIGEIEAFGKVFIGTSCKKCEDDVQSLIRTRSSVQPLQHTYDSGWMACSVPAIDPRKRYVMDRVATFTGEGTYGTIIGNAPITQGVVTTWAVRVAKSRNNNGDWIWVGVAPIDVDQNADGSPAKSGWYLYCYDTTLYSGPPHNFNKKEFYKKKKSAKTGDEVGVTIDLTEDAGKMSFALNGKDLGTAFIGIPLDKPLVPAVVLRWQGDTVEIKRSHK